jgi:hypothetical protein
MASSWVAAARSRATTVVRDVFMPQGAEQAASLSANLVACGLFGKGTGRRDQLQTDGVGV